MPRSRWRSTRSRADPRRAALQGARQRRAPPPRPRARRDPCPDRGPASRHARLALAALARGLWRRRRAAASPRPISSSRASTSPSNATREGWAERLGGVLLPTGTVRLVPAGPVEELPGYADGEWWVQDAAAALPAKLLGDVAGKRVADLCAAPGGKTAAAGICRRAGDRRRYFSVDASSVSTATLPGSASRRRSLPPMSSTWTPDQPFDAVLLDAPCTGDRHDPPPSRHSLAEKARGPRGRWQTCRPG